MAARLLLVRNKRHNVLGISGNWYVSPFPSSFPFSPFPLPPFPFPLAPCTLALPPSIPLQSITYLFLFFPSYMKYTLDQYVENDYSVVYFHHGLNSRNKPSLSWVVQVYHELDRK